MISFLIGSVFRTGPAYVDVDVRGVGYRVFVPEPTALRLQDGAAVTLFTHHHVREDAHQLFGFLSESERDWFEVLLTVSGIGPKVALQMVAAASVENVVSAIQLDDVDFLTKLPGVGKKTAQRLLVELKDKVAMPRSTSDKSITLPAVARTAFASSPLVLDVAEALQGLGYPQADAFAAAEAAVAAEPGITVEDALRRGLQDLGRVTAKGSTRRQ